ncbi:MAG: 2,3-bisphosphoglycerate-independent phosphoglycerate mutase [Anaerolineales bacterium]|nr:2,3-bisphosphoglycerate-independent phosphoglycerate mutase [Anaerolineales bacterium]
MANFNLMSELNRAGPQRIVLLILDGLGGLPIEPGGMTELEAAKTPNLDQLASEGILGQIISIAHGITPGSGPAHLSLFGYDPLEYGVGRGVLEASGVGMKVKKGDVAARGNFCTVDEHGYISDRRAGRIATEEALPLTKRLAEIQIPGVQTEVRHVKEYRFAIVMSGDGLEPDLRDTDPQRTGVPPLPVQSDSKNAQKTADLYNQWIAEARELLKDEPKANALTLRGFSTDPEFPQFEDIYGLNPVCVAVYPMYKGVSCLVGMDVKDFSGDKPEDEFAVVSTIWSSYDFFFVHIKKTDSMGEDGNFDGKVSVIESVDTALPALIQLAPDVLAVTGDHSTPSLLRKHSWHSIPLLLWAPSSVRPDDQNVFGESSCARGGLGTFHATSLMPLLLAHAGRLEKYGA